MLTSFPKIFEKDIFNRLHFHVLINNILLIEQQWFKKHLSTETTIFSLINILQTLYDGKFVGGIFCDLGLLIV
jgi:hypothetical protein